MINLTPTEQSEYDKQIDIKTNMSFEFGIMEWLQTTEEDWNNATEKNNIVIDNGHFRLDDSANDGYLITETYENMYIQKYKNLDFSIIATYDTEYLIQLQNSANGIDWDTYDIAGNSSNLVDIKDVPAKMYNRIKITLYANDTYNTFDKLMFTLKINDYGIVDNIVSVGSLNKNLVQGTVNNFKLGNIQLGFKGNLSGFKEFQMAVNNSTIDLKSPVYILIYSGFGATDNHLIFKGILAENPIKYSMDSEEYTVTILDFYSYLEKITNEDTFKLNGSWDNNRTIYYYIKKMLYDAHIYEHSMINDVNYENISLTTLGSKLSNVLGYMSYGDFYYVIKYTTNGSQKNVYIDKYKTGNYDDTGEPIIIDRKGIGLIDEYIGTERINEINNISGIYSYINNSIIFQMSVKIGSVYYVKNLIFDNTRMDLIEIKTQTIDTTSPEYFGVGQHSSGFDVMLSNLKVAENNKIYIETYQPQNGIFRLRIYSDFLKTNLLAELEGAPDNINIYASGPFAGGSEIVTFKGFGNILNPDFYYEIYNITIPATGSSAITYTYDVIHPTATEIYDVQSVIFYDSNFTMQTGITAKYTDYLSNSFERVLYDTVTNFDNLTFSNIIFNDKYIQLAGGYSYYYGRPNIVSFYNSSENKNLLYAEVFSKYYGNEYVIKKLNYDNTETTVIQYNTFFDNVSLYSSMDDLILVADRTNGTQHYNINFKHISGDTFSNAHLFSTADLKYQDNKSSFYNHVYAYDSTNLYKIEPSAGMPLNSIGSVSNVDKIVTGNNDEKIKMIYSNNLIFGYYGNTSFTIPDISKMASKNYFDIISIFASASNYYFGATRGLVYFRSQNEQGTLELLRNKIINVNDSQIDKNYIINKINIKYKSDLSLSWSKQDEESIAKYGIKELVLEFPFFNDTTYFDTIADKYLIRFARPTYNVNMDIIYTPQAEIIDVGELDLPEIAFGAFSIILKLNHDYIGNKTNIELLMNESPDHSYWGLSEWGSATYG